MTHKQVEHFQDFIGANSGGGSSLNQAYSNNSSIQGLVSSAGVGSQNNLGANNEVGYNNYVNNSGGNAGGSNSNDSVSNVDSEPKGQSSGFGNIWKFIGIEDMPLKKNNVFIIVGLIYLDVWNAVLIQIVEHKIT